MTQATVNITAASPRPRYNPMEYWDNLYKVRSAVRETLRYLVTLGVFLAWAEDTRRDHPQLQYTPHLIVGAVFTIWLTIESRAEASHRVRERDRFERSEAASKFSEALTDTVYWTMSLTPRWVDGKIVLQDAVFDEAATGNVLRGLTSLYMADSQATTELINDWRTARWQAWLAFQKLRACPTITEANKAEYAEVEAQLQAAMDALVETCNRCSDRVWLMVVAARKRRWFRRH